MKNKKIFFLYGILIFLGVYFFIVPVFTNNNSNKDVILQSSTSNFNEGFTYQREDGTILEAKFTDVEGVGVGEKLILTKTLYDIGSKESSLAIRLRHHALRVFIDDELIFSTGYNDDNTLTDEITNNFWEIIPLPEGIDGKKLTLEFLQIYEGLAGEIPHVEFADTNNIVDRISGSKVVDFGIGCTVFFMGILIILIHINMGSFAVEDQTLLYLGYTAILLSLWLLSETDTLQLIFDNKIFLSYLPYFALLLFPLAISLQFENSYEIHHRPYIKYIYWACVINAIVCTFLHVTGIIPVFTTFHSAHIFFIVFLVYSTTSLLYEAIKYKNQEARRMLVEVSILSLFGMLELISFYSTDTKPLGYYLRLGLIFYLTISFLRTFRKIRTGYEKSKEAQYFKKLAYVDQLTSGGNRAAYERDLIRFTRPRKTDHNTWLILMDANSLKDINDTKGHAEGDRYLQHIYNSIDEVFKEYGSSYRIGGDEFASILTNITDVRIFDSVEKLQEKISLFTEEYSVGVAAGFAEYSESKFGSIPDFIEYVDHNMYNNKKLMKGRASK